MEASLTLDNFHNGPACTSHSDFIRQCGADVLFEMSVLHLSGEPAATYIREALGADFTSSQPTRGR